jgi:hypothetical protein
VLALGTGFITRLVLAAIAAFGVKVRRHGDHRVAGGACGGFAPVTALDDLFSRARVPSDVPSERRG